MAEPFLTLQSTQRYLDKALGALRELGLMPDEAAPAPILPLLDKIADLDEERVVTIARTLTQAPLFNEVVRNEIEQMSIGQRYEDIAEAFNSIRDDAKSLVDQISDGKIDTFERLGTVWMKVTRGDISSRFDKIRSTYLEVTEASKDQIEREHRILEAYLDFRGALKQSEVMALEVLKKAEGRLDLAKEDVAKAMETLQKATPTGEGEEADPALLARLELARDEKLRDLQAEEKRYQIAKDLADNLTIGYSTSEVIMARLQQTTNVKERVYQQSVSFFSTNETVLTALNASFTGLHGLHESTQALNEMKEGVSKSLETLADIGGKVQEEALKAGYGPTIRADAVKALVDSVINYQERSRQIIQEMRTLSTKNSTEIREAVEDGKTRIARLAQQAAA